MGSGSYGTLSLKEAAVQLSLSAQGLQNHTRVTGGDGAFDG